MAGSSNSSDAVYLKDASSDVAPVVPVKPELSVVPFEGSGEGGDVLVEMRHGGKKHLSKIALLGMSFAILNTWAASSISLYVGIARGGSVAIVYGMMTATFCATCVALSLSELCHVFPTAGAQYHWQFALSNTTSGIGRFGTYISGFLGAAGWLVLTCSGQNLVGSYVDAAITMFHPNYTSPDWVGFVVSIVMICYSTAVSMFGARIIDVMNKTALGFSLAGAVIVFVVLLAASGAHDTLRDGKFVFATFTNGTGWSDGICWILGLLNAQFALVGADAAAHLVNEVPHPSWDAPMAMVISCVMGGCSGLVVLIAFLAAMVDPKPAVEAQAGAVLVILDQALQSKAGALVVSLLIISTQLFAVPALNITANHMVAAIGRDNALPYGRWIGHVSERWEMPVNAAMFVFFWQVVIACLAFAGDVLAAVQSSCVILLHFSYLPCLFAMLLWGRSRMDELGMVRKWSLGHWPGIAANCVAIAYQIVTIVFFLFPSEPITSDNISSMNWAIAVVGVVFMLAVINWFLWSMRHYKGPSEFLDGTIRFQALYS